MSVVDLLAFTICAAAVGYGVGRLFGVLAILAVTSIIMLGIAAAYLMTPMGFVPALGWFFALGTAVQAGFLLGHATARPEGAKQHKRLMIAR